MKFEFIEGDGGVNLTLIPENTTEYSQLARFAKNARASKPLVYMSLSDNPQLGIYLNKISKKKQSNGIGNY